VHERYRQTDRRRAGDSIRSRSLKSRVFNRTRLRYVRVYAIANPSVPVCLSVSPAVLVYSAGWNFWQYFYAILYVSHPLTFMQQELPVLVSVELAFGVVIFAHRNTVYRRFWTKYKSGTLMWLSHTYSVGIAPVGIPLCPQLLWPLIIIIRRHRSTHRWKKRSSKNKKTLKNVKSDTNLKKTFVNVE